MIRSGFIQKLLPVAQLIDFWMSWIIHSEQKFEEEETDPKSNPIISRNFKKNEPTSAVATTVIFGEVYLQLS